ncbi:MAG: ribosomal L7Ae/L30e/S12e/Gadd45 family protein [Clostridia bacterium]|nr:ribosomal L7Ae/L30e/S12e/Gadd45 family protein [Clostridia bacterium]
MNDKILTLLGFASKAGRLSYGFNASSETIKAKKSGLVVTASDISDKTKKEIRFIAEKSGVKVIELEGTEQNVLSNAVGRSCGIVLVNDSSFASAIAEEFGRKC